MRSAGCGSVDGPWREPGIEDLAIRDVVRRVDLCRHEPVDGIRVPRRDRFAGEDVRIAVHVPDPLVVGEHPVPLRHRVEQRRAHRPVLVGETPVTPGLEWRREVGMHDRALRRIPRPRIDRFGFGLHEGPFSTVDLPVGLCYGGILDDVPPYE